MNGEREQGYYSRVYGRNGPETGRDKVYPTLGTRSGQNMLLQH
jgi:hypothetical protein